MRKIHILDSKMGLNKVLMSKAIRLHCGMNLAEAKQCTDTVLEGDAVVVTALNDEDAQALYRELTSIGAIVEWRE